MENVGWIDAFGKDIRYAARGLRRGPGLTLMAILTLALGIGANIAAFTVVRAVLLNPLPNRHPEQLVRAFDDLLGSNSRDVGMSAPELWDLRDRSGVFQDLSAVWPTDANVTGGDHPERIEALATDTSYFGMLAARPHASGPTPRVPMRRRASHEQQSILAAFDASYYREQPGVCERQSRSGLLYRVSKPLVTFEAIRPGNQ